MRRIKIASAVVAVLVSIGLVGCSEETATMQDAYKVGCPAIDAASATGSVANKVAVRTLKEIRDRGNPSPEAEQWLDAAIEFLTADDPGQVSQATRERIIKGCADHGYELQNLG
jgi:hypothetical protein